MSERRIRGGEARFRLLFRRTRASGVNIVVGSGPAGVATAAALLRAGQPVTMIDAGIGPDTAIGDLADGANNADLLRSSRPGARARPSDRTRIPDKLARGSDYPYRRHPAASPLRLDGTGLRPSSAVGGLSNVWGSAALPFSQGDVPDWPIKIDEFVEGYVAATDLMGVAGVEDGLSSLLPTHGALRPPMALSRQAQALHDRMRVARDRLHARGIAFGRSRLAVDATHCVLGGECLKGCPRGLIYSATTSLERLRRDGLRYESGTLVKRFRESDREVQLDVLEANGSYRTLTSSRAFLAAGVVNTAEIMLRSVPSWGETVTILDSQYFLAPALTLKGTRNVVAGSAHALAQLFVELLGSSAKSKTVHLQVYSYSEAVRDALMDGLGRFAAFMPVERILGHLLVLQGYLHSDLSGKIRLTLQRNAAGGESLELVGVPGPDARRHVRWALRRLLGAAPLTGFAPVLPLTRVADPGRGFHSGGSFPLRRNPGRGETDLLGRPAGFSRVHLVDASVLPSIPATTITLSVMANAHRIATGVLADLRCEPSR